MTNRRTILFLAALQLCFGGLSAQDPVFSHFYANGLNLNPSLAGLEEYAKTFIGYRNQWPGTGSSFISYQAAHDQYVEKLQGGIGLHVLNDRQGGGTFNIFNLDAMYAYQFRATRRLSFSGGIQAGFGQRSFNPINLRMGDMIDPLSGETLVGLTEPGIAGYSDFYPDFASGVTGFYGVFYAGLAMHHMLSPVIDEKLNLSKDESRLPRRYTLHAGAMIPVIEKGRGDEILTLSPNLVFIQQGSIQQVNYGMDVIIDQFLAAIWTRHDLLFNYGNLIFSIGYGNESLKFRYSYDIRLSSPSMRIATMAAHEISLVFVNKKQKTRNRRTTIKCPKI